MSVTGYAGMVNLQKLSLEMLPPEEVYAGRPATFRLVLKNGKGKIPSFLLEISSSGSTAVFPFIAATCSASMPISMTFNERGHASLDIVRVSSAFPVNFFVRSWGLPVDCSFLVFPEPVPSGMPDSSGDGEKMEQGSTERRGTGGEVERILEYTGREPLKQIHWKLSARSEEFKVKEFGDPAAEPILVDIDRLHGTLESRVSAAAWMVRQLVVRRPVGLKLGDEMILPVQGRRQMMLLLGRLAVYGR